jgi:hypothetical protein
MGAVAQGGLLGQATESKQKKAGWPTFSKPSWIRSHLVRFVPKVTGIIVVGILGRHSHAVCEERFQNFATCVCVCGQFFYADW